MIEINWTIALQFVNFLVLMGLLHVLLFRPVRALLAERKATIDGGHGRARELKEQIEAKMARYQEQLQLAKQQGNEEKAALRSAAAKEEAEILGAAHEVATDRLKSIRERVAGEADKARSALQAEANGLAAQVATRVLGRGL